MATTIKLKNGSGVPTAGDLVQGEPALDLTNKRLYTEDSGGTVIEIGTTPTSLNTTGTVTFGNLSDGTITVTAFVDEDNMASDSATLVPTQQSVKAYVDSQIGGVSSSLSGLSDTNITSPADGALLFYDTGTSTWIDNVVSGDVTIADTGVAAIGSGVIVNDDINASAAISVSKTALVDGTGLTLTGDTLSVDASQTQITAVGTIATGTWQGTAIADAYVADNLTISGGTVDNSVIGGTTAAAGTFTDLTASGTLTLGGTAVTSTAAELNILDGVTATAAELNILDGVTATTAELNYTDGVTSNIQTQLDSKIGASYTGDVDITGELLVDSYNETFKKVSSVGATVGYQISSGSYDSVSFSISSQETNPQAVEFSSDGTKMYILGTTQRTVYQYTLSTAFDVSTASYASTSFSVSSQALAPRGVRFKSDGTKMYVIGSSADAVFQYSLSTAWDVSTASYDSVSFSVASQTTTPEGLAFKSDGTEMYVCGDPSDDVYQYTLSTAWDLSTASYTTFFTTTGVDFTEIAFNADGTSVFLLDRTTDAIIEYSLSTAWNISTATSSGNTLSVASQEADSKGIAFNATGTKVYIVGESSDTVYQYSTSATTYSTTFDCENANVFETELDANTTVVFSNPPASGTPVVSYYQIASASYTTEFSVSSEELTPTDLAFNSDGTKMFVIGYSDDEVNEYALSTGFDISTASYTQNFSVASQDTQPEGLTFNNDGTKMFVLGNSGTDVNEYTLSTGFDVSTASYSQNFSVASQEAAPEGIAFNNDGTKMFIVGRTDDEVNEYALSTGFDISTASFTRNFSVASQDLTPTGLDFNSDGTKMFVIGRTNDSVYEYTLTTGFNISTASYTRSLLISDKETNPTGIRFSSDGAKMFIIGYASRKAHEYATTSSSLNDSTAYAMSLKVVQDASASGYTVTWPTSVDWPSATAPTLTATASAVDQFVFYTYDGGTTWYGFTAGQALG